MDLKIIITLSAKDLLMKSCIILSLFLVSSLSVNAKAPISAEIKLPSKISNATLTLSALPSYLVSTLKEEDKPSASGHLFYDKKVVLKDKNGKLIDNLWDLKENDEYEIDSISSIGTFFDIWFFSPNGSSLPENMEDVSAFDYCTFEKPCKNINQSLVDKLHMMQITPKFWFAGGTYQLPKNERQNDSQVLMLYNNFSLHGRSSDFIYKAVNEERPLFIGSLLWIDFAFHDGGFGHAYDIRSQTSYNPIDTINHQETVNFFSMGTLYLQNVSAQLSLPKEYPEGYGTNVYAKKSILKQSKLNIDGYAGANIKSENVSLYNTHLKADSFDAFNIDSYELFEMNNDIPRHFYASESQLEINNACIATSIHLSRLYGFSLSNSTIKMTGQSDSYCHFAGIDASTTEEHWIGALIQNSEMYINLRSGVVEAVRSLDLTIEASKITLQAEEIHAMTGRSLQFTGNPSTIIVNAQNILEPLFNFASFKNLSTPASQCQINSMDSFDCYE